MPFAKIQPRAESQFKKTLFMTLEPPNQYVIRILDSEPYATFIHWINGSSVECLGEDCPQCELNKKILVENPKDGNKVRGYASKSQRFAVNVFDLTPVKTCPKCDTNNLKTATVCSNCDTFLDEKIKSHPLKVVKVVNKGVQLFDAINGAEAFLNGVEDEEVRKITDVDLVITVSGTQKKPSYAVIPLGKKPVELPQDLEKYDTEKVMLQLNRKEMLNLMSGVQLRDILLSRSANRDADSPADAQLTKDFETAQTKVEDLIKGLYENE